MWTIESLQQFVKDQGFPHVRACHGKLTLYERVHLCLDNTEDTYSLCGLILDCPEGKTDDPVSCPFCPTASEALVREFLEVLGRP